MKQGLLAGALAIVVATGPGTATATAEDWPGYGGGGAQSWTADSEPGEQLGVLWRSVASDGGRAVIVSGGSVYAVANDPELGVKRLVAVDAATGAVRWQSPSFEWADTPAADAARVYVADDEGVIAYAVADGAVVWRWQGRAQSPPAVADGALHFAADGEMVSLDAATGDVRWRTPAAGVGGWTPPLVLGGAVVHPGGNDAGPRAFGADDGVLLWQEPASVAVQAGRGDTVYLRGNAPLEGLVPVTARHAVTGAVRWTRDLPDNRTSWAMAADEQRLYVRSVNRYLTDFGSSVIAYDRATGAPLWNSPAIGMSDISVARLGSRVFTFDGAGGVSYDPVTGERRRLAGADWAPSGNAAYADSTFYGWQRTAEGELMLTALRDVRDPELAVTGPEHGAIDATGRPSIGWTVDDGRGSGVARVEWLAGDRSPVQLGTTSGSWQPDAPLPDGTYPWQVRVRDRAGNERRSDERLLQVDTTAPRPFALLGPAAGAGLGDVRPALSWSGAEDATAGVAEHRVSVDGVVVATLAGGDCAAGGVCAVRPSAALADGAHTWKVTAVDRAGHARVSEARTFTVAAPPSGTLNPARAIGYAGEQLELTAAFADPNGAIVSYAWDLDGDGSFERPTGTAASTTTRLGALGGHVFRVRVTDDAGLATVATAEVEARLAPPGVEPGASINGGAVATNRREVEVTLSWPALVTHALVSNDGGFGAAGSTVQMPIARTIRWTLPDSGAERLPKTVYVRFRGGDGGRETYTDDIVLDQTAPLLDAVVALPARGTPARARARTRTRVFRVRARDAISGVVAVQVSARRSAKGAVAKRIVRRNARGPHRWNGKVTVRAPAGRVWVRALDAAGNGSKWRRAAR